MFNRKFPNYIQLDITDCGPTCLRIISKYYGKSLSIDHIRNLSNKTRIGTSLLGLNEAAEKLGYKTLGVKTKFEELLDGSLCPCIVFWEQKHFVVVYKVTKNKIYVSDPGQGLVVYSHREFKKYWTGNSNNDEGILLLLEPTDSFFSLEESKEKEKSSFDFLSKYLFKYRHNVFQLIIGLVLGSFLQLIFPFLTQAIIDVGIQQNNLDFIYLILFAQLFIFIGMISIEVLRRIILMHISSRINIQLLSDFFSKIFSLPISYYDTRVTGDILQRINDHSRIESFLTSGTLNIFFSAINIIIFSIVLLIYNTTIFLMFVFGSAIFLFWISLFIKKRAQYDYQKFNQLSENNEKNLELINGMQEIKLNNVEVRKRWEWEWLQAKLFKINLKGLDIENWENVGSSLINEFKNIVIIFYTAKLVLDGQLTLGMMLSISYIMGQINAPLNQILSFVRSYQDAKLSMERINDIYKKKNESDFSSVNADAPSRKDIILDNVYFNYKGGRKGNYILKNISVTIPFGKTTAIVGASGSGKTTLMKLLLKFYNPSQGDISLGNVNLKDVSSHNWRDQVGVVLQEGFIFSDTIANNIAVTDENTDFKRLYNAAKIANIHDFITTLPMSYDSEIGAKGITLSTGQRQRILIARAVYKNPDYLFFDEATSALDTKNERTITDNLDRFLSRKTAVVVAHRLSTVKNADQIIVLDEGTIKEIGTHQELIWNQGTYFNLIKNQLELGV